MKKIFVFILIILILTNCSLFYRYYQRGSGQRTSDWLDENSFIVYCAIERYRTVSTPTSTDIDHLYNGTELWKCDVTTGEKERIFIDYHDWILYPHDMNIKGNILCISSSSYTWCFNLETKEKIGEVYVDFGVPTSDGKYVIGAKDGNIVKAEIGSDKEEIIGLIDSFDVTRTLEYFYYNEETGSYVYSSLYRDVYVNPSENVYINFWNYDFTEPEVKDVRMTKLQMIDGKEIVSVISENYDNRSAIYVELDKENNFQIYSMTTLILVKDYLIKSQFNNLIEAKNYDDIYEDREEEIFRVFDGENEIMTFSFPMYSE